MRRASGRVFNFKFTVYFNLSCTASLLMFAKARTIATGSAVRPGAHFTPSDTVRNAFERCEDWHHSNLLVPSVTEQSHGSSSSPGESGSCCAAASHGGIRAAPVSAQELDSGVSDSDIACIILGHCNQS